MKVDIEIARQEVEKWLEYKRVGASKREAYKDAIDSLVDAVAFGQLTLEDDYHFVQHLDFPIEGDEPIEELKFKPRIKVKEIHSKMRGVKARDSDGRVMALIAALTGKPSAMVGMLETSDYSVSQNIALFFL